MKTEKYIDYGLAKEIFEAAKEQGYELPESEYVWNSIRNSDDYRLESLSMVEQNQNHYFGYGIPAYDTYELGEMLPPFSLQVKGGESWEVGSIKKSSLSKMTNDAYFDGNEPQARGKMFLYLLKNDLL